MARLRDFVLLLLGLYLLLVFLAWVFQEKLLFFPAAVRFSDCEGAKRLGFRGVETEFNSQKVRYLIRTDPRAKGWLVIFHGNASTACSSLAYYMDLRDLKVNFILAAYPGYEGDHQKPGEALFLKNAEALLDHLNQQNSGKLPVILLGESLGSGVATYLASVRPVGGLILRTPYTSISDLGAYHYPFLPISMINRNPFPAYLWARAVNCPVLILHGTSDRTVPFQFGQRLAGSFRFPVEFVAIGGADHNSISAAGDGIFWEKIKTFINRISVGK